MSDTNESAPLPRLDTGRRYLRGKYEYYEPATMTAKEIEEAIASIDPAHRSVKRALVVLLQKLGNHPSTIWKIMAEMGPNPEQLYFSFMRDAAHYCWDRDGIRLRLAQGGPRKPQRDPEGARMIQVWRIRLTDSVQS